MTQTSQTFTDTAKPFIAKGNGLFIPQQTLQKILFWGNHYQKGIDGNHSFSGNGVEVDHKNRDDSVTVDAQINRNGAPEIIKLKFEKTPDQNDLKFHEGMYARGNRIEILDTPQRLIEIGLCLYKNVRAAQDPKWGFDLDMRAEARAAAAQLLDTGMLPVLVNNGGQIEFNPPKKGLIKACKNPCGKCRLGG